jgi:hypothetical protein
MFPVGPSKNGRGRDSTTRLSPARIMRLSEDDNRQVRSALMTAIAQAMLRARVECRRFHGGAGCGRPERGGGEDPLSDHTQASAR